MSEYYAPPGADATPKPLALYRDRLRCGYDPASARLELYMYVRNRWCRDRKRPDIYRRHEHKIVSIALNELERNDVRAA